MNLKKGISFIFIFVIMLISHIYLFKNTFYSSQLLIDTPSKNHIMKINLVELQKEKIQEKIKNKTKKEPKIVAKKTLKVEKKVITKKAKIKAIKKQTSIQDTKVVKKIKDKKTEEQKVIHSKNLEVQQEVEKKIVAKTMQKRAKSAQIIESKNEHEENRVLKEYILYVYKKVQNNKLYPKLAKNMGIEGECKIGFRVLNTGKIVDVMLLKESDFSILNKASVKLIQKINTLKAFPDAIRKKSIVLEVPIKYYLKG